MMLEGGGARVLLEALGAVEFLCLWLGFGVCFRSMHLLSEKEEGEAAFEPSPTTRTR